MIESNLRVIIVAEHASARFGGEAMLPLHYFSRLRHRGVETWLVVHARTRDELSELLPNETDRIFYVPDTWLHRILWRASRLLPDGIASITTGWLSHLLTQLLQRRIVKRLIRTLRVDVVHEPIPVSPALPSMMFGIGAPVVIGPLNGGMGFPPGFSHMESLWERSVIRLARAVANPLNQLIPGKKRAAMVLVSNERTRWALPRCVQGEIIELVENGVDLRQWRFVEREGRDTPVTFVFVGRLVALKAVDLLLEAFAIVRRERDCRLRIVGEGPQRQELERKAESLSIQQDLVFHGFVEQKHCPPLLAEADVMVMPSLHECGGAVVLEAMATGLPVIATRWGGPGDYLDQDTGILVPPVDRGQLVQGLAQAMAKLCDDRQRAWELGRGARRRVEQHFDWDRKIERIVGLYGAARTVHGGPELRPSRSELQERP